MTDMSLRTTIESIALKSRVKCEAYARDTKDPILPAALQWEAKGQSKAWGRISDWLQETLKPTVGKGPSDVSAVDTAERAVAKAILEAVQETREELTSKNGNVWGS